MKALLSAVKKQLQTDDNLDYIRDKDICIVPHEDYVPKAVKPPFITLKDGKIVRRELVSDMMEYTLEVKVSVWVQVLKDEASIMGSGPGGKKGILEVADDVHESLDENLLGITGMQEAFSPAETESEPMGDESQLLQKKTITYQYIKEGSRP